MKSGFVSVIGRPSTGKSTMINALCGYKVSIVSSVPQTTRNKIRGIVTEDKGQVILVDTPGYHISDKKMNLHLNDVAVSSLRDSDGILYVVDASRPPGKEESNAAKLAQSSGLPLIAVINKIDLTSDGGKAAIETVKKNIPDVEIALISSIEEEGLDLLLDKIFSILPEGDMLYPKEFVTDQPPEFRISEIIREKAVNRLDQELPHALYVEISDLEQQDNLLWIRAFIVVERKSQVGIVVGHKGEMIHKIRTVAKREIKTVFPDSAVKLDLRVKVEGKWRKNDHLLDRMLF